MAGRCPLCGASNSACGQRTTTEGIHIQKASARMTDPGEFKLYETEINGYRTTLRLNEEQARERGLFEAAEPAEEETPVKAPAKARAATNKARTAANK